MNRKSENGYCECRCFFKGENEENKKKAKEMLVAIEIDYDKGNEHFRVNRLDYITIFKRYNEIQFLKNFRKIATEKIEKTKNYLPKYVEAKCIYDCSRDYCRCGDYHKPTFDAQFSILTSWDEIFGEYFKTVNMDKQFLLTDTIRAYDYDKHEGYQNYGWVIEEGFLDKIKNGLTVGDEDIYESIQCVKVIKKKNSFT